MLLVSYIKCCKKYPNVFSYFYRRCSSKSSETITLSNGPDVILSTGQYARLADGASLATMGNTTVLATVVGKPKSGHTSSFAPLLVDFRQKSAAAGRIPTNFFRREHGLTEREVLVCRLIDRSLRPLFPKGFNVETQVVCNMLAVDSENNPDIVAINAASTALALSDVPWNGPIGAVRVGYLNDEVIINPTRKQLETSPLNLVVTVAKKNLIVMLEGHANCILQQDLLKAIKIGTKEAQKIIQSIQQLSSQHGKEKRSIEPPQKLSEEVVESLSSLCKMRITEIFKNSVSDKLQRDQLLSDVRKDTLDQITKSYPDVESPLFSEEYDRIVKQIFRNLILEENIRCDGRDFRSIRPISCDVNLYKPLHGSAVFQRGQTQVFCTVTLDSHETAQKLDPMAIITSGLKEKNFFLHYEFPPYATKEIGKFGYAGRREIGHGALAEKALMPIIPNGYAFTIRLTSEVLESNGSSSMASVCGGSLALMDAGVPISSPAAGIAIGLVTEYDQDSDTISNYRLLTDILGIEDYFGDMDFKFAGTRKGVTALQLDLKLPGLPLKIVMEAIMEATAAKSRILDTMDTCIYSARTDRKDCWPVSKKLEVEVHKRARLLGVGGINLKKLFAETGVHVTQLDETNFELFAPNEIAMDEAEAVIRQLMETDKAPELEFGGIYTANVVELRDIGVMVTLYSGMPPALLHNSQLDQRKVGHPSALGIEVGQELQVKYFGRDPVSGLMRLSRKVLQATPR